MRENDGRKLDHRTLEVLRLRAVEQVQAGAHPEQVAATLGLHRKTVYGWLAKFREGGPDALVAKPVPGRPPKLSGAQIARLHEWIVGSDPAQFSFEFALWTRDMVRQVIRREFQISLSVVSVGRLLRTMGLSPATPAVPRLPAESRSRASLERRAVPGHPQAGQGRRGHTIYFADEAGVRSDYHAGTTWAPVGRTPTVRATGARFSLNMLSAVSAQGALRFMLHDGTVNVAVFIEFCKRLLRDHDGPVYLVVDGHPAHRARATTDFVTSTDGRLKLFLLPAYSPELNPDEWVWKNVKHDRAGKTTVTTKDDLKATVISALRRLQKLPALARGFFADPCLRYINA